ANDRARPFDLAAAPLLRVTLARLPGDAVRVVWTFHHVLLDGWSVFQVLSDVFAAYAALVEDRDVPPAVRRPFSEYLRWLGGRDQAEADRYWRRALTGLSEPTPLPYDRAPLEAHRAGSVNK